MGFPLAMCWVHIGELRGKVSGGLLNEILMDTRCKNKGHVCQITVSSISDTCT